MKKIDKINIKKNTSIIQSMKNYNEEDFNLYVKELGWEDWMNEFIISEKEDEEISEISEKDNKKIDDFLKKIWKIAFNDKKIWKIIFDVNLSFSDIKELKENFNKIYILNDNLEYILLEEDNELQEYEKLDIMIDIKDLKSLNFDHYINTWIDMWYSLEYSFYQENYIITK